MRRLLVTFALSGCAAPERQRCRLAEEVLVATSDDMRLGALVLETERKGKRAVVAWSDRGGVRTAALDARTGRPGPARVVLEGGATAMAIARDGDGYRLAAVVPDDPKAGGGGAHLLRLGPDGEVQEQRTLGPAGVHSQDVAIVATPRGFAVAWHDGAPGEYAIRTWIKGALGTAPVEPGRAGLAPSLARDGDGVAIAWAEMAGAEGEVRTLVRVGTLREDGTVGAPRDVGVSTIEGADPVLLWMRGGLRVVYRDQESYADRAGYYVTDARPRAERFRVSRANGTRSPSVTTCHGTLAAAAIRTFQGEYLVGFNRFDLRGNKRGGELQIYCDGVHFGEAAMACLPDGYALAYAEEGDHARILFTRASCAAAP